MKRNTSELPVSELAFESNIKKMMLDKINDNLTILNEDNIYEQDLKQLIETLNFVSLYENINKIDINNIILSWKIVECCRKIGFSKKETFDSLYL